MHEDYTGEDEKRIEGRIVSLLDHGRRAIVEIPSTEGGKEKKHLQSTSLTTLKEKDC